MEEVTPTIPRQALIVTLIDIVMQSHGALLWPNGVHFGAAVSNKGWVFIDIADVPQLAEWARLLGWRVDAAPMKELRPGTARYSAFGYLGGWAIVLQTNGPALDTDPTVEFAKLVDDATVRLSGTP